MPYVDPQTIHNPTTATIAPASWGDGVRDALQYLSGGFPHASIKETTAQSIAHNTAVDLTSDEEDSDIGGLHSTSSNTARLTVPASEGGLYRISATVTFAANATGYRTLALAVNGVTGYTLQNLDPVQTGGVTTTMNGSRSLILAAGDYVTCQVFQTSGSSLNCTMVNFSMEWRATA